MIQKKICMVGVFATGKTSLVRQWVESIFSDKYHSTVGVKIDRKPVEVGDTEVNLLLWDLAGRDEVEDIKPSYLRGAAGIFYVADGTRRETFEQVFELHEIARQAVGEVPSIVGLNKADLRDEWQLGPADYERLSSLGWHNFTTSALTGAGVEEAFTRLATLTLGEG